MRYVLKLTKKTNERQQIKLLEITDKRLQSNVDEGAG